MTDQQPRPPDNELVTILCGRCKTPLAKVRPYPGLFLEIKCRRCSPARFTVYRIPLTPPRESVL